ncbi:MAG: NAD(P)/FAD-dependent oxidoreductase, partial [Promethearchaeota archaeon]
MSKSKKKLIVIGGDAAGLSAASAARRFHKDWDIVVYEKGNYISYAACGIPYFVGDLVKNDSDLITITRKTFLEKRNIPVMMGMEVLSINAEQKTVKVRDVVKNVEFIDHWDYLVIATGASPRNLPIPGADLPNVFKVRGLDTGVALKQHIMKERPRSAAIIGGGNIALEMAEGFKNAGIEEITIIYRRPRLGWTFPENISEMISNELAKNGVRVILSRSVKKLEKHENNKIKLCLDPANDDDPVVDFVLIGIGVIPNTQFLKDAGLKLDKNGAIDVDEFMKTNIPGIWAAGDCANVNHVLLGKKVYFPLATIANKQGRYAGYDIAGHSIPFPGTIG